MDKLKKPYLSVCIPTSDMEGKTYFLKRALDSLWNQNFQDFEIVVTDNSTDGEIEAVCGWYGGGIRYIRNPRKGMAQNTNEGIKEAHGRLIKLLYMDDFMANDYALGDIVTNFSGEWLVTGCSHTTDGENFFNIHEPSYNDQIHLGNNTIGSPSVLTILNKTPLLFDEEMTWLLDADYYKRMHDLYGDPVFLNSVNVIMGVGQHQMTNTMGYERKLWEENYIKEKYA